LKETAYIRYLIILSLLFGFSVNGQPIQVGSIANSDSILVGGQFIYRIESVQLPEENWPLLTDSIGPFEIIEIKPYEIVSLKPLHIRQDFILTHFDTGKFAIPPTPFIYGTDSLFTSEIDIQVLGIPLQEENAVIGIKGPINIPIGWEDIKYYVYSGIGLLILLLLIFLLINRFTKNKKSKELTKPSIPAHIIALGELESLKSRELWQNNEAKEYYSELSDILRTYIENRYHILAMESTTDEINRDLHTILENSDRDLLNEFLTTADLVKFAKGTTDDSSSDYFMEVVKRFVHKTKLVELTKEE